MVFRPPSKSKSLGCIRVRGENTKKIWEAVQKEGVYIDYIPKSCSFEAMVVEVKLITRKIWIEYHWQAELIPKSNCIFPRYRYDNRSDAVFYGYREYYCSTKFLIKYSYSTQIGCVATIMSLSYCTDEVPGSRGWKYMRLGSFPNIIFLDLALKYVFVLSVAFGSEASCARLFKPSLWISLVTFSPGWWTNKT